MPWHSKHVHLQCCHVVRNFLISVSGHEILISTLVVNFACFPTIMKWTFADNLVAKDIPSIIFQSTGCFFQVSHPCIFFIIEDIKKISAPFNKLSCDQFKYCDRMTIEMLNEFFSYQLAINQMTYFKKIGGFFDQLACQSWR